MRTLRPVSSSTSRSAVSSRLSPGFGRALGERPGPAVALAAPTADDEPRTVRLVTDDDAAGGRGGRGPQAGHGADAAPGRRTVPGRPDLAHSMATSGRGRPLDLSPRHSGMDRAPARPKPRQRGDFGAVQHGRPGARGAERSGRTEPEPALPDAGRWADESGRRAGRVLGRDAVIHGRLWYRFGQGLQGRRQHGAHLRRVLRCQGAPRLGEIDLPVRRRDVQVDDAGRVDPERVQVRAGACRRRRASSDRSGRPGSRAPGRCPGFPR